MLRNLSISLNVEEVNLLLFLIPFCEFNFVIQYENSIEILSFGIYLCRMCKQHYASKGFFKVASEVNLYS